MARNSELVIRGLDVELTRVTEADLELLRGWRNDPEVRRYMVFQGEIDPAQQARWFAELDKQSNYYFVIHHEGSPIGLSHIKHIDWQARTGEAGIFLVPQSVRNSLVAYRATLPGADFTFDKLGLESVVATVKRDNRRAFRFNHSVGHVAELDDPTSPVIRTRQTRAMYAEKRKGFEGIFGPFTSDYEGWQER